jgi:tryptophanyl-tRNA synthetase
LEDRLQSLIAPIRERCARFGGDRAAVLSMLEQGTRRGREKAASTLGAVKRALGLAYFA